MAIQAISFGNNIQTASAKTEAKKKMGPVKKGAVIGGGIYTGLTGVGLLASKAICKAAGMTFSEAVKKSGGWGKYFGNIALNCALWVAVGAGIGAIVKAVKGKEDKEIEKLSADEPVKEGANVDANA